jgi:hypothetical protein
LEWSQLPLFALPLTFTELAFVLLTPNVRLPDCKKRPGIIYGKRVLISQALGPKARLAPLDHWAADLAPNGAGALAAELPVMAVNLNNRF